MAVKIVDPCGRVFKGTGLAITPAGVFDAGTPAGFEIFGSFISKRMARGTITDPGCRNLRIRTFTIKTRTGGR